jgi:hypothetical protein
MKNLLVLSLTYLIAISLLLVFNELIIEYPYLVIVQ